MKFANITLYLKEYYLSHLFYHGRRDNSYFINTYFISIQYILLSIYISEYGYIRNKSVSCVWNLTIVYKFYRIYKFT